MTTSIRELLELHENERFLFVFDNHVAGGNAELVFDRVKLRLPAKFQKAVIGTSHVDDKQILPLQAADALAWIMRRHAAENPSCDADLGDWTPTKDYLEPLRAIPRMHTHYPIERLRKIISDFKAGKMLK
jgi:hypothetical protein